MEFAKNIKHIREENHLSQKDIADYLGITRQAVASYELEKREPDYKTLVKLADFFDISIDYLLGRSPGKNINTMTVAANIKLIKGNLTFEDLSDEIFNKTHAKISADMLKSYASGERMPFMGAIKVLAQYASIPVSFFYKHNTYESYHQEKKMYVEEEQPKESEYSCSTDLKIPLVLNFMDINLARWVLNKNNLEYIKLAREIQGIGILKEKADQFLNVLKIIYEDSDNI